MCNSKQKWNHDERQYECKESDDWSSCKDDYIWNPSPCDCESNKACKMDKYLDIKNCSIDKLVLACEDEILNATENSLDDKKITLKKNTRFIHTISLVIACLLLLIYIGCFYYYTGYWKKQKDSLPYYITNNKLKELLYWKCNLKWVINSKI